MPTGFTDIINNKTTFQQFAMRCARNFGALILMRDDDLDAPIPEEFKPSDYHERNVAEARAKIAKLDAMSASECDFAALEVHAKAIAEYSASEAKRKVTLTNYERILAEVRAWVPPTPDHQGMKDFMIEQITTSIRHDCSSSWSKPPARDSGAVWRERQRAAAERDIAYHLKAHDEEVERARVRTKWVRDLRASLAASRGTVP